MIMTPRACEEFRKHLETWLEESHDPLLEAHLRSCPQCSGLVEDLGAIRAAAFEWAYPEEDPSPGVWFSLRARLETEGLIHRKAESWWKRFTAWLPALSRPALAGAYLAGLVAIAFAVSGPVKNHMNRERWLETAQDTSLPLQAHLTRVEEATVSSLPQSNSAVTASLEENLAIVDNYIVLCEKSVQDDPQSEVAREYLYDAYQQKAELLAEISERGEYGQ
jgi:hypothetical protein